MSDVVLPKKKVLPLPDWQYLLTRFSYDPETGAVTRLTSPRKGRRAEAGFSQNPKLGLTIKMDGTVYAASRVIWKMVTGDDPPDMVDHEDRNRQNNRWVNLRDADCSTNGLNRIHPPRKSGLPRGLYTYGRGWIVRFTYQRQPHTYYRGYDLELAKVIAIKAARQLHGEFYCPQGHELEDLVPSAPGEPPLLPLLHRP